MDDFIGYLENEKQEVSRFLLNLKIRQAEMQDKRVPGFPKKNRRISKLVYALSDAKREIQRLIDNWGV